MIDASTNVLVTGGRGFIGSHLVRILESTGAQVTSVDVTPVTDAAKNPREVVLDVRDRAALEPLGRRTRFDIVFDLASQTAIDLPKADYRGNVDATKSMLSFVREFGVRRYIFFSTQFVFRRPNRPPADETDFYPVDYYGASKVESEIAIRNTLQSEEFLILRPTYVWGPGLTRFRDGLLLRLAKRQLLISSDPSLVRYYGYVKTVCEQAVQLASVPGTPHTVYYVSDDGIDLKTFCDALKAALGRGKAVEVPSGVIRTLGFFGDAVRKLGLPAPINSVQAREITTNFPIPIDRTLNLVSARTQLAIAAKETVAWAESDAGWVARTR